MTPDFLVDIFMFSNLRRSKNMFNLCCSFCIYLKNNYVALLKNCKLQLLKETTAVSRHSWHARVTGNTKQETGNEQVNQLMTVHKSNPLRDQKLGYRPILNLLN